MAVRRETRQGRAIKIKFEVVAKKSDVDSLAKILLENIVNRVVRERERRERDLVKHPLVYYIYLFVYTCLCFFYVYTYIGL